MKTDNIQIEILDDGTIKITTDPISGANHTNAEGFLREIANLAGGETTREKRTDKKITHSHDHHHTHTHTHDHKH
jgi:hypothetical protein